MDTKNTTIAAGSLIVGAGLALAVGALTPNGDTVISAPDNPQKITETYERVDADHFTIHRHVDFEGTYSVEDIKAQIAGYDAQISKQSDPDAASILESEKAVPEAELQGAITAGVENAK